MSVQVSKNSALQTNTNEMYRSECLQTQWHMCSFLFLLLSKFHELCPHGEEQNGEVRHWPRAPSYWNWGVYTNTSVKIVFILWYKQPRVVVNESSAPFNDQLTLQSRFLGSVSFFHYLQITHAHVVKSCHVMHVRHVAAHRQLSWTCCLSCLISEHVFCV